MTYIFNCNKLIYFGRNVSSLATLRFDPFFVLGYPDKQQFYCYGALRS
jgi:hypothetical protein